MIKIKNYILYISRKKIIILFRLYNTGKSPTSILTGLILSTPNFMLIFFPTCQVKVIRFYQNYYPPPFLLLIFPRPCLYQLPPPLSSCQFFAKLLANFRAECVLLDFNLGPSEFNTGPQPGTFPSQYATLDLNLGPC